MSRYLVFAGDRYYPFGGWEDRVGTADDLEGATELAANACRAVDMDHGSSWYQIVDTSTGKIVSGDSVWGVQDDDPRHALWEGERP